MKVIDIAESYMSDSIKTDYIDYSDWKNENKREANQISSELKSLVRNSVSTANAYELQEEDSRNMYEYEAEATKYNKNKIIKDKHSNQQKNDKNSKDSKPTSKKTNLSASNSNSSTKKSTSQSNNSGDAGSKASQAGKSAGSKVPWQAAINLQKSMTPDTLKAENYTPDKNARRINYISEGSDDIDNDASSRTLSLFTEKANKAREIHFNASVLAWNINWIAGLAVTVVPILIAVICFALFVVRLGIDVLPAWSYSSTHSIRQLMTQYEYYWDCTNQEVAASVENQKSDTNKDVVAVPITLTEEGEWSAEKLEGENFVNWRAVLAVYYAGLIKEETLPEGELISLSSDDYMVESLFATDNSSFFNEVFWTMNCIIPSGDVFSYDEDDTVVCYNICYHPSLSDVKKRLGYDYVQSSLVDMYMSAEYDFYFDELIKNRHISSSQYIVDIAAAEVSNSNHGSKYKTWYGDDCEWCNVFVNWCLEQSGNGQFMGTSGVTSTMYYYMDHPEMATIHYVSGFGGAKSQSVRQIDPQPGWLIVFDSNPNDSIRTHIGIVESYDAESDTVITIEGNTRHEETLPEGGNYVARMHRSASKGNICCFVELKYADSSISVTDRYGSDFNAKLRLSEDDYSDITLDAEQYINRNEDVEMALNMTYTFLEKGVAEWNVMYGLLYIPGTDPSLAIEERPLVLIRIYSTSGLDEDLKKITDSGLPVSRYWLSNHFTEYSKYYKEVVSF